jgi:Ca2+-transporting ATPase
MTKGALDRLLTLCNRIYSGGCVQRLTDSTKREILKNSEELSGKALRVLGAAFKDLDQPHLEMKDLEQDLVFIGFVGMMDPPRLEVKQSIARCKKAGIRTVMITGDHRNTAFAIAKELGVASEPSQAIAGGELDGLSDKELMNRMRSVSVFARVSPEHKVRIVKALKAGGNIVSMTGDGVNDAPSLQAADIGVAMGITGTDVARGASDMVLTDDNFTTIVSAIEKGRNIYNNIKKSILFLLSCNAGEIICIFTSILLGWLSPLIPIHILWVNLVTDTLPALALGMDPDDPDVLKEPPRGREESLFAGGGTANVIGNGILIALLTLIAYRVGLANSNYGDPLMHARTMAFAVLSLSQLVHAFNMRHLTKSVVQTGFLSNLFLIGAVFFGIALQVSVISVPPLAGVFKVVSLTGQDWLIVGLLSIMPLILNELFKLALRLLKDKD